MRYRRINSKKIEYHIYHFLAFVYLNYKNSILNGEFLMRTQFILFLWENIKIKL